MWSMWDESTPQRYRPGVGALWRGSALAHTHNLFLRSATGASQVLCALKDPPNPQGQCKVVAQLDTRARVSTRLPPLWIEHHCPEWVDS